MPIYAYKCASCGHSMDVIQKIADAPLTDCPECGASTFSKQVTAAGFQLKGSGWYVTDFRDKGAKKSGEETAREPAKDAAKDAAKDSAKAGAEAAAKPAAKPAAGDTAKSAKPAAPSPAAPAPASAPSPGSGGNSTT